MKRFLLSISAICICLSISNNAEAHHGGWGGHHGFGGYMERSLAWQLPLIALGGYGAYSYGGWGYNRPYYSNYYNNVPVYNNYYYNSPPPPPPPPVYPAYPVYRNFNYNGTTTWMPR